METRDLGWLAGLLEGEGCFVIGNSASLLLQMTDRDVVQRASEMLNSKVSPHPRLKLNRKPLYYTAVHGSRAAAWMMTLWPFMGERRRAKILECLRYWRSHRVDNRDKEFCKRGHPLSGDNVRVAPLHAKLKQRICRTCQQQHHKNYRSRQRSQTDVLFHRN